MFLHVFKSDFSHPACEAMGHSELSGRVRDLARAVVQVHEILEGIVAELVGVLRRHRTVITFESGVELVAFHIAARLEVLVCFLQQVLVRR